MTPLLLGAFNFLVVLAMNSFDYDKINTVHASLIFLCLGIGLFNFIMPWNDILESLLDGLQT